MLSTTTLLHLLVKPGYLAVLLVVAQISMGIPAPGETMLVAAAGTFGTTRELSLPLVIGSAESFAVLGDNLGYWIGASGGARLLPRYGCLVRINERKLKLGLALFPEARGESCLLRTICDGAAHMCGVAGWDVSPRLEPLPLVQCVRWTPVSNELRTRRLPARNYRLSTQDLFGGDCSCLPVGSWRRRFFCGALENGCGGSTPSACSQVRSNTTSGRAITTRRPARADQGQSSRTSRMVVLVVFPPSTFRQLLLARLEARIALDIPPKQGATPYDGASPQTAASYPSRTLVIFLRRSRE